MDLDRFSSLIEALYDSALDAADWSPLALMFAQTFGTESCAIFHLNLAQGSSGILGITDNFDDKAISDYEAYYHQKDLVAIRMAQSATGRAMLSTDVVRESEFLDSEIFVDFARPMRLGFYWAVGGVIEVERHVKGAVGIHRPRDTRAFEAEDKHRLAMLLPHLSRAMLLQRRLQGLTHDKQIVLDALEKLSVGMIAVDAQGAVLFANPTAERLLRAGLGLTCRHGYLGATDPTKEVELRRLIQQAGLASLGRPSEAGGMLALPRPKGRPLSLLVCPLPPHALTLGASVPAALLIFGDPDASPSTSTQALIELYGLTPAEARLMAALVDGERLDDYADRQQISINTARTQLKQIFAKTGRGRQTDLIREALANPAVRVTTRPPHRSLIL
jgi:DNA-binding CsgD family transcriptional regulator/PAS domain-containing protein